MESSRLPASSHPGRVILQVADLTRSIDYYERVIGFQAVARDGRRAVLGPHGSPRPLLELQELRGARPVPHRGRLGLYHFAILVPDRAALGRFLAHLAAHRIAPGMSDHLVSEALYLSDPDGLGIEVYADRPRDTWRFANGQVAMAANPLDADAVIRAGRGEPWTGMPDRTVIGHVHLFVADLDKASAFYHGGIGFDRMVWSYPGALFLSAGGYHHHLGVNTWAAQAPVAAADDARLLEWELVVGAESTVHAIAARLAASGTEYEIENGVLRARDPWGTTTAILATENLEL